MMLESAESEHPRAPRLCNREIIMFEEFQTCDHNPPTLQTDGRTDGPIPQKYRARRIIAR